jgi:hypothetical protein
MGATAVVVILEGSMNQQMKMAIGLLTLGMRAAFVVALLMVAAPAAPDGAAPPEVPSPTGVVPGRIASSSPAEMPLWISADEAISGGKLREELFMEYHRGRIRREVEMLREIRARSGAQQSPADRAATQEDCTTYTFDAGSGPYLEGKPIGLATLFEWAEVVVVGRVTSRAEGFLGGFPTSLYRLAVRDTLKAPADLEIDFDPVVFFTYPLTSIAVEGELICNRPRTYPRVPEPGRRALVFGQRVLAQTPTVVRAGGYLVVFEDARGEAVLPWLEGEVVSGPPWEQIAQRIEEIAHQP